MIPNTKPFVSISIPYSFGNVIGVSKGKKDICESPIQGFIVTDADGEVFTVFVNQGYREDKTKLAGPVQQLVANGKPVQPGAVKPKKPKAAQPVPAPEAAPAPAPEVQAVPGLTVKELAAVIQAQVAAAVAAAMAGK